MAARSSVIEYDVLVIRLEGDLNGVSLLVLNLQVKQHCFSGVVPWSTYFQSCTLVSINCAPVSHNQHLG